MYPSITNKEISLILKPRKADSHKGTYGHSLLIAGSKGKMGAAVIAAKACLRTGTGLLTVNIPFAERGILQSALPEAMLSDRKEETEWNSYAAIGIGPATGITARSLSILKAVLTNRNKALLIDADAITLLAKHKELWTGVAPGTVLTPHPAEFDRMFGKSEDHEVRMKKAITLSEKYNWVIVLKDHQTLIAFKGAGVMSTTGNAGLAKGGSGDMLSGMITALLAQGYEPFDAAKAGVHLHGIAADIAIKDQSMESLLATDVIECIGKAFKEVML